jgi:hypothetical protein
MIGTLGGVRNAAARRAARRLIRLGQVEILVGQRSQDVIRELGRARVGRTFLGRVRRLGNVQTGRILVQVLHVADRLAAVHGDRGRQAGIEELALIVADDHDSVRRDLVELPAQRLERRAALHEALAPLLHHDLLRKARRAGLEQRRIVVRLAAIPVVLVLTVRLRPQIPLLRRRGQQRPM